MDARDAIAFLAPAIPVGGGTWLDLGAGEGTFTQALAELLGEEGQVYAVDRDARAVRTLRRLAGRDAAGHARIVAAEGDLRRLDAIEALRDVQPDGVLLANALHFAKDPAAVLERLSAPRVVVIEYDRERGNRWVPYPLTPGRLDALARAVGRAGARVTARRPSRYQGAMYCAVLDSAA